jgi:drug/metabolite transporter (DMT)-like permease
MGRAALMMTTTALFFFALGRLPLVDVFVLSFTAPVFTALFAAALLGERVGGATWGAIALALAGVAIILAGQGIEQGARRDVIAYAAALGAPVTYALGLVLLRFQTLRESLPVIVFTQSAMIAVVLALPVALTGALPAPVHWPAIAALGVLSAMGYMAFVAGLRGLGAARFAVVEYTGLVWATLIGIVVFAEWPGALFWPGAALVIAGCSIASRARAPG